MIDLGAEFAVGGGAIPGHTGRATAVAPFGLRRQSKAATALWDAASRPKSGVVSDLPPQSKSPFMARGCGFPAATFAAPPLGMTGAGRIRGGGKGEADMGLAL